jgi:hypothetical protein
LFRFNERLRALLREPLLREGQWTLLFPTEEGARRHLLTWTWTHESQRLLVMINWSGDPLTTDWPLTGWTKAVSWLGHNRYLPSDVLTIYPFQHLVLRLE